MKKEWVLIIVLICSLSFASAISHPAGQIIMPGGGTLAGVLGDFPAGAQICTSANSGDGNCSDDKGSSSLWQLGTGAAIITTAGNVGIGIASPATLLHVNGNVLFGASGGASAISFEQQTGFHRIAFNELRFWDWGNSMDIVTFNNRNVEINNGLKVGGRTNCNGANKLTTDANGWLTCETDQTGGGTQVLGTSGNQITLSGGGGSVTAPYATNAGGVLWSNVGSKPTFASDTSNNRVKMAHVGCGGSWASSCDGDSNGWADYADSADSVPWSGVTGKPTPSVGSVYTASTAGGTYFARTNLGGAQWDFCALVNQDATYWGDGGECSCNIWYKSATPPQWYLEAYEAGGSGGECDIVCKAQCFDFG